ncbi:hypothetical protein A4W78_01070 [Latilactobacillus curvatus]|nr:hypothetical protein A4W78_01070 [Latilactobacillus curvatus]
MQPKNTFKNTVSYSNGLALRINRKMINMTFLSHIGLFLDNWKSQFEKARLDVQNRTAKKLRLKYFFNLSFFIFV